MALEFLGRPLDSDEVTSALTLGTGVLLMLYLLKGLFTKWRIDSVTSSIPTPPGSLPFFGHALSLASGAPWDTIRSWVLEHGKESQGNMIKVDFMMQV